MEQWPLGSINEGGRTPKFLQIAERIRELIYSGKYGLGERLPSVNIVIKHFEVSRDTVVKAFQHLKRQGIIESSPSKAYFVSNIFRQDHLKKVLLLVDTMAPYKEELYYGLIDSLDSSYYVDIVVHGDNFEFLRMTYESYAAMPECVARLVIPTLSQNLDRGYFHHVNPGSLLLLDRNIPGLHHHHVGQEFAHGFHTALQAQAKVLRRFPTLLFLTKYYTNPIVEEMSLGFSRFAGAAGLGYHHLLAPFSDRDTIEFLQPQRGEVYFVLDDHLLANLLRRCTERGLALGKDVGVAVINKGPLYQYLATPLSVLSADFYRMGTYAAHFVLHGKVPESTVPTRLEVRESLAG